MKIAHNLAREYLIDESFPTQQDRIASLINWETSKNFTSGIITGLGGILTLPIAVPAALGSAWIIQARMAGAIAMIHGHDLNSDRVRTLVLLSIVGDAGKEILKQIGITAGNKFTLNLFKQVPGRVLIEINKKVGFRLLTKAGETGVVNLTKAVPIAGSFIGGSFDAITCRIVDRTGRSPFRATRTRVNLASAGMFFKASY